MTTNCKIELFGTVSRPPKLVAKNDMKFLVLSVATRDSFVDEINGKNKEKVLYHDIIAFNSDVISTLKSLQKGEKLYLTGTLSYKPIEANDGFKKPQASIVALNAQLTD
jgi:single-stranded DNA-binding protein